MFHGTVFSGSGQGKKFIQLPWVRQQLIEKTGFDPYPGTLNIRLTPESLAQRSQLEKLNPIKIEPKEGYCPGLLFKAEISGVNCFIVAPQVPNYPKESLELIAKDCLRKKLKIKDGDCVTVEVMV
jgi:riboflavin kinase, archaea type